MLAVLGVGIDLEPHIKFNPVRWLFKQIGNLFFADAFHKIDALETEIKHVKDDLKETIKTEDMRRIKTIRIKIQEFANSVTAKNRDREDCDEIFDLYEEYEALLEKYGMENGRTDRAMDKIQKYYDILIAKEL